MKTNLDFDSKHPRRFRIATVKLSDEMSVVEVGYNIMPKGLKQILQRNVYILHYVTEGKGFFNGVEINTGTAYLVVPGEPECIEATKEKSYKTFWIMFRGTKAAELLQLCGLPRHNKVFPFGKGDACAKAIEEVLDHIDPSNEYQEASLMLSAFYKILSIHLHETVDYHEKSMRIAAKMRSYMEESYHMAISIEDFAKKHNITRNYLYTLFKKEYGVSPKEFLMNLRIEKAKLLLSDQQVSLNIGQIAYAVGFEDALYFSRVFRQRTGMSPKAYLLSLHTQ